MQLSPARGRKQARYRHLEHHVDIEGLCSSAPRGDGNSWVKPSVIYRGFYSGLYSSAPRGDGNSYAYTHALHEWNCLVYAAQPREGTETNAWQPRMTPSSSRGLCSSAPRGDGNKIGTKAPTALTARFMQLNPARGRKLVERPAAAIPRGAGLCSSTPRGDGNGQIWGDLVKTHRGLCSSTPRGDGN